MIPVQIKIKNFLSYGPNVQTIDFAAHHLICLTGKNGHGKSALLDALTWALWGQARKVSGNPKADQGLLRLGQSEMMVIFDFTVGESTYRVKREFITGKVKSQQYLEFGLYDSRTERLIPLTDKTIRATQALINKTIGLDFETFINSAFIRQGQSNEFSTKSPKDRKEILCSILGLSRFEKIRKLVVEQTREHNVKKEYLKNNLEHIYEILKQEESHTRSIEEAQQEAQHLIERQQTLIKQVKNLNAEKEQFTEQQQKMSIIEVQYEHQQKVSKEYKTELTNLIYSWRNVHQKNLTAGNKNKLEDQKKILEAQIKNLQQQQRHYLQLKEKIFQLKEEEQKLRTSHEKLYAEKLHTFDIDSERCLSQKHVLEKNLDELRKNIEKISSQCTDHEVTPVIIMNKENAHQKKQAIYARLTIRKKEIIKEQNQIQQKMHLIASECGVCPLCNQQLEQEHKHSLHMQFLKRKSLLTHQEKKLAYALENVPEELDKEKKELTQLTILMEHKNKISETEEKQKAIQSELCELERKITEIQNKRDSLNQQDIIPQDQREKLAALQDAIATTLKYINDIQYNEQKHEETINQLNTILPQLEKYHSLENELWQQPRVKVRIHELCALLRNLNKESELLQVQLRQKSKLALKGNEIINAEQSLTQENDQLAKDQALYLEKKGRLDQQKQYLDNQKKEAQAIAQKVSDLEKQIHEYQLITSALGKDGIQALLIEEALPEIEDEANRLLAKLTDNSQQIFIESLRDLKSGRTKETLDIKISDSMGIRAYELFSGGEAFRIDFALRIAISKLLARRAGAALQTLVIDEGFGSQDEEGLAHIMDALHRIQDDFAKIIIVSHLQSMQSQFPSQFFVSKTSHGSHVQIFEQG